MAALPSPTQVAGSHAAIYEAYYNQVDPNGYGTIGAMEAAKFLKKSQLSDVILSKIWDMSDPQSRGTLDKSGMFVALKLCAFAQAGRELKIANLSQDIQPPKMGDIPIIQRKSPSIQQPPPPPVITSVTNGDWSIKPTERVKYDALFDSLQPMNGYIPGNKVKGVLMDSKLPLDTLGKIWDLADMDKDGMLDRHEFVIAMHLVYKALEKYAIPNVLPPELMPPGKRKDISLIADTTVPIINMPQSTIPTIQNVATVNNLVGIDVKQQQQQQPQQIINWVVLPDDQAAADKLFLKADMDMDGFVSGHEIKDIFLQSGLAQTVLAHIWGLCDIGQSGKLNKEQFALSMWLIKQRMRGIEPPISLTPEMIPPSFRKNKDASISENNSIPTYSNPELDMISKDIQDLARERRVMEQDIAQKEADIKIKTGEIKSLQSELDTLAATLKQLETQKGEAQKRLNDLKAQRIQVDNELAEIERTTREEQEKVDKLRQQAEEQESVLRTQEEELNSKRQELEGLRQEEQQLEQKQNSSRDQLNELSKNLQNTQLQISQAKAKITNLEEKQRQMSDAIAIYDSALATGDPTIVPDSSLQLELEIDDIDDDNDNNTITNGHNNNNNNNENKNNGFTDVNGSSDRFNNSDPFSSNKNKDTFDNSSDPFTNFDARNNSNNSGFTSDPFAAKTKDEAFDPFGDKKNHKNNDVASKDAFGDDPFANLHAPTRAESPSPALPPKKAKQPPPRPAPPRPAAAPNLRAAPAPPTPSPTPDPFTNTNNDPFSSQNDNTNGNSGFTTTGSGFADFANFDAKPELFPNRTMTTRPTIGGKISSPTAPKLHDFTEDPFRNYRYEDPFSFADPFADDEVNDNNGNKKNKILDPFGFETNTTITQNNDLLSRGFESDFTNSSLYTQKKNNNNFFTDNNDTFKNLNDNNNIEFVNTINQSTKPINFDEAFSINKNDKIHKHKDHSITQVLKDKLSLKHGSNNKNKNNNNNNNNNNNGSTTWKKNSTIGLSEQQQLQWAAQQSLKAEEERRRIKAQEDADLALALELSKHD